MSLHLFDSASRSVREFHPVRNGTASIYVCGPTPQGPPHIGHMRGALNYDVLRRWLAHRGLDVTLVRNVTDIDDKILTKAARARHAVVGSGRRGSSASSTTPTPRSARCRPRSRRAPPGTSRRWSR